MTLDDKRDDVKATLERYSLPWETIFFEPKEGQGRGFENPLASKLQISYIPALFLIDREGKYIGTDYQSLEKLEYAIALSLGLSAPLPDPKPEKETADKDLMEKEPDAVADDKAEVPTENATKDESKDAPEAKAKP